MAKLLPKCFLKHPASILSVEVLLFSLEFILLLSLVKQNLDESFIIYKNKLIKFPLDFNWKIIYIKLRIILVYYNLLLYK